MVINIKTAKCAWNALELSFKGKGATTLMSVKLAPNTIKKVQPKVEQRLFSFNSDPVIGTRITNNITGTTYLQRPSCNGSNVSVGGLTTFHRADGSYGSIPQSKFDQLLACLRKHEDNWNPVIKSDPTIGKELRINNPNFVLGAGRYFRSACDLTSHMLTKLTPQHHNSVNLADFDKAILDLLG